MQEPVLLHFYPFGAINYENLEYMHCYGTGQTNCPLFLCFDQEPITNHLESIIEKVRSDWGPGRNIILLNTESNSITKNNIISKLKVIDCYYFFHIFAAADWYRGYQYCADLIEPNKRKINKKFITFNRLTGNSRAYRSLFVAALARDKLLDHGHISYSAVCPEHGHYGPNILDIVDKYNVPAEYVLKARYHLDSIQKPLRIDKQDQFITNGSQTIDAIPELMESFLHVVTETCFWETKDHLTEKIFKPIVAKQPFVLLGCANNLKYLKSYGFKTFNPWWDESYDAIQDPIQRLEAVVKIINDISAMSNEDLEAMLRGMKYVLDHNYNLFYSKDFINTAWKELQDNVIAATAQSQRQKLLGTLSQNHRDNDYDNKRSEYQTDKSI